MASEPRCYICTETQQTGCRPSRWFTFTWGGACLLFLLTFEGEEDSWQRLWEAGGPGGEETESQEEECHSWHQRWPGQPLRPAHDCTAQELRPVTTAWWRERSLSERNPNLSQFPSSFMGKTQKPLFPTVPNYLPSLLMWNTNTLRGFCKRNRTSRTGIWAKFGC